MVKVVIEVEFDLERAKAVLDSDSTHSTSREWAEEFIEMFVDEFDLEDPEVKSVLKYDIKTIEGSV